MEDGSRASAIEHKQAHGTACGIDPLNWAAVTAPVTPSAGDHGLFMTNSATIDKRWKSNYRLLVIKT